MKVPRDFPSLVESFTIVCVSSTDTSYLLTDF